MTRPKTETDMLAAKLIAERGNYERTPKLDSLVADVLHLSGMVRAAGDVDKRKADALAGELFMMMHQRASVAYRAGLLDAAISATTVATYNQQEPAWSIIPRLVKYIQRDFDNDLSQAAENETLEMIVMNAREYAAAPTSAGEE